MPVAHFLFRQSGPTTFSLRRSGPTIFSLSWSGPTTLSLSSVRPNHIFPFVGQARPSSSVGSPTMQRKSSSPVPIWAFQGKHGPSRASPIRPESPGGTPGWADRGRGGRGQLETVALSLQAAGSGSAQRQPTNRKSPTPPDRRSPSTSPSSARRLAPVQLFGGKVRPISPCRSEPASARRKASLEMLVQASLEMLVQADNAP